MKKIGFGLISAFLLLVICFLFIQKTSVGVGPFYDNFMGKAPIVKYYVSTDHVKHDKLWSGKDRYTVTGYDEHGNQQRIVFVPSKGKVIKPDHYIWITAKASSGKGWSYIEQEKIPAQALAMMK